MLKYYFRNFFLSVSVWNRCIIILCYLDHMIKSTVRKMHSMKCSSRSSWPAITPGSFEVSAFLESIFRMHLRSQSLLNKSLIWSKLKLLHIIISSVLAVSSIDLLTWVNIFWFLQQLISNILMQCQSSSFIALNAVPLLCFLLNNHFN